MNALTALLTSDWLPTSAFLALLLVMNLLVCIWWLSRSRPGRSVLGIVAGTALLWVLFYRLPTSMQPRWLLPALLLVVNLLVAYWALLRAENTPAVVMDLITTLLLMVVPTVVLLGMFNLVPSIVEQRWLLLALLANLLAAIGVFSRAGYGLAALMLLPTLALLLLFSYIPALIGLSLAFTRWEVGDPSPQLNWLQNFGMMAHDEFLRISVRTQVLLLLANMAKTLIFPLIVAELLVHLRSSRGQYLLRTAFILPMVVPGMVTILLWRFIYDGSVGVLNQMLEVAGLGNLTRAWLGDASTALLAVVGIGFPWAGGLALLIYLAGLMGISKDVWDSSALDGATGLRRVWHIDLPLLLPQVRLLVVLTIIGNLQDFGSLLVLTGGGPGLATHVPALHMYFQAFRFGHFGYAAAIGLALFVVIFVLSVLNMRWGRRQEAV